MNVIRIRASDVASIIGRNKYKPRREVLEDMWKRYSPSTFLGKTKYEKGEEAVNSSEVTRAVVASAVNAHAKDSTEVQKIYSDAVEKINSDTTLNTTQKAEVIEHVRSKIYTSHGSRSENATATKVEFEKGVKWSRDNSFYSHDICEIDGRKYTLVGKIDRIEELLDGSRILIEIKNRTNRLFGHVVDYEMIQVQVYLHMLDLVDGRLVEQYNDQVLSHDIKRDQKMWSDVIYPGLEEFCSEFHSLIK